VLFGLRFCRQGVVRSVSRCVQYRELLSIIFGGQVLDVWNFGLTENRGQVACEGLYKGSFHRTTSDEVYQAEEKQHASCQRDYRKQTFVFG
jgi:hypothetical protein